MIKLHFITQYLNNLNLIFFYDIYLIFGGGRLDGGGAGADDVAGDDALLSTALDHQVELHLEEVLLVRQEFGEDQFRFALRVDGYQSALR